MGLTNAFKSIRVDSFDGGCLRMHLKKWICEQFGMSDEGYITVGDVWYVLWRMTLLIIAGTTVIATYLYGGYVTYIDLMSGKAVMDMPYRGIASTAVIVFLYLSAIAIIAGLIAAIKRIAVIKVMKCELTETEKEQIKHEVEVPNP